MATALTLPLVDVGVDPFVLRSALHAALAGDDRFEVVLCPSDEDPHDHAATVGADLVLVSCASATAGAVVLALLDDPPRLSLITDGRRHDLPYDGMGTLAQTLANAASRYAPG